MPHAVSIGSPSRLIPTLREWHPWLVALAIVTNVTSRNVHCVSLGVMTILLLLAGAVATGVYLTAWLFRRATPQASAMATLLIVALGLYGRAFDALLKRIWAVDTGVLHGLCILVGLALLALLWRSTGALTKLSTWLSLTMLLVLGQSGLKHVTYLISEVAQSSLVVTAAVPLQSAKSSISQDQNQPDIYYLILDGYARADVLRNRYDVDNSEFLDGLRDRGFYVADKSCTNYPLTFYSLSSSLNMKYHEPVSFSAHDRDFYEMIRAPQVAQFLKQRGYRFVHFNSPWPGTSFSRLADLTIGPKRGLRDFLLILHGFSAFTFVTKHNFAAEYIAVHRQAFVELPAIAELDGPTFTFAHFIAPHPPFVFDREGNGREDIDQSKRQSYSDELLGINREVTRIIDSILKRSTQPPIIIIQADHGPAFFACAPLAKDDDKEWVQERVPIMNAYLVPENVRQRLYPTITPVNSFRVLLSECFGADLPLLPDHVFMTHYRTAKRLADVSEQVVAGVPGLGIRVP